MVVYTKLKSISGARTDMPVEKFVNDGNWVPHSYFCRSMLLLTHKNGHEFIVIDADTETVIVRGGEAPKLTPNK